MVSKKKMAVMYILMAVITVIVVFPFAWMFLLSMKTNSEIMLTPLSMPASFNLMNFVNALQILNYGELYSNTFFICIVSILIELTITFLSAFVLARMEFNSRIKTMLYSFLIMGLAISPFILLFPVYKINLLLGLRGKAGLIMPYVATSISFNTLLFVGYLKALPKEIDEAAIVDGTNLWQLIGEIIIPMAKPVIATVVIFNVLYIWNEYPFASVMLRDVKDYTLSMGVFFFKGKYSVDYGGIIASSIMIIIPELIFYGLFQKSIVDGMTAGAVKG
ncbi:carbohydrate ABC transporter permease [Lacrimispora sp. 38-1]|uniref:carbohydrate ABC transporter permease n=1 Tax=Lacrimispora sp. 38-1 TaxID=3125778 RepID=UPI003CE6CFD6